jgi:hypothetical protein
VTQVTKIRGLIALTVLVSVAALVGASGSIKAESGETSVSTSVTLTLPGFFRGR